MTYDEGRKPENVPWTEMPAPNGNARQNNRTQVVSHKAAIGLRPCKGLVVVPADMGGGAVIEYHHQTAASKTNGENFYFWGAFFCFFLNFFYFFRI